MAKNIIRGEEGSPKGRKTKAVPMTDALSKALRGHRHLRGPRVLCTEDGSAGLRGRVTDHLDPLLGPGDAILACGPNPMFAALAARLAGRGVPCQVSTEEPMACGTGLCFGCVVPVRAGDGTRWAKSCVEGPTFPLEDIRWDRVRSIH